MERQGLENILWTFAHTPLPALVHRNVALLSRERKADALIGMRRSGKTYAMFDRMSELVAQGVPRGHMLYLSLDDERLGEPDLATLGTALETFFRLSPEARTTRSYLFLDEIQVVDGWERFVRRVLDTENVQVVVGGSSAKLLSAEVHTSLRGRGHAVEVLPYGFREALRAAEIEPEGERYAAPERSRVAAFADTYLARGGFPEVQGAGAFEWVETLHEYVELVVLRDVVERHGVTNIRALRHLVRAVLAANANQLSVSSLHGALVSQGIRVTKNTLFDYLGHLTDAYLCFLVPIRTRSEKQRVVNPKKVYAIDQGLASANTMAGARNRGALLENAVYLEVRRRYGWLAEGRVSYYRTAQGREVDFAVDPVTADGSVRLIQACSDIERTDTVTREAQALDEAMAETGVSRATLVSLAASGELQMPAGTVEIVPFWEWALRREI